MTLKAFSLPAIALAAFSLFGFKFGSSHPVVSPSPRPTASKSPSAHPLIKVYPSLSPRPGVTATPKPKAASTTPARPKTTSVPNKPTSAVTPPPGWSPLPSGVPLYLP